MSQAEQIVKLLKAKGADGATNYELNKIAFRYSARIAELRKDGVEISTVQIKKGLFKYTLGEFL